MLTALLSIATGIAYVVLGGLAVVEVVMFRRSRGFSRLGVAYAAMDFTCGPHHLVHGIHLLDHVSHGHRWPLATSVLVSLVPAGTFVALRLEAALGGRGDRRLLGLNPYVVLGPIVFAAIAAVVIEHALPRGHGGHGDPPVPHVADVVVQGLLAASYVLVGWFLLRTQLRRFRDDGAWSLSGVALTGIFPTCALTHVVHALTAESDALSRAIGALAVPAALAFLVVVHHLYGKGLEDWHRRPLAGGERLASRPSPWRREQLGA